jgi:hypothetical protein
LARQDAEAASVKLREFLGDGDAVAAAIASEAKARRELESKREMAAKKQADAAARREDEAKQAAALIVLNEEDEDEGDDPVMADMMRRIRVRLAEKEASLTHVTTERDVAVQERDVLRTNLDQMEEAYADGVGPLNPDMRKELRTTAAEVFGDLKAAGVYKGVVVLATALLKLHTEAARERTNMEKMQNSQQASSLRYRVGELENLLMLRDRQLNSLVLETQQRVGPIAGATKTDLLVLSKLSANDYYSAVSSASGVLPRAQGGAQSRSGSGVKSSHGLASSSRPGSARRLSPRDSPLPDAAASEMLASLSQAVELRPWRPASPSRPSSAACLHSSAACLSPTTNTNTCAGGGAGGTVISMGQPNLLPVQVGAGLPRPNSMPHIAVKRGGWGSGVASDPQLRPASAAGIGGGSDKPKRGPRPATAGGGRPIETVVTNAVQWLPSGNQHLYGASASLAFLSGQPAPSSSRPGTAHTRLRPSSGSSSVGSGVGRCANVALPTELAGTFVVRSASCIPPPRLGPGDQVLLMSVKQAKAVVAAPPLAS